MGETDDADTRRRVRSAIDRQYAAACSRAMARGFVYALVETVGLSELMGRIEAVRQVSQGTPEPFVKAEAVAMLGGVPLPAAKVSDAFERYFDEIALGDLIKVPLPETALAQDEATRNSVFHRFGWR
jgi:hypothetical protein